MQIHPLANSITKTLAISDKICVVVNTALHLKLWCFYMQSTTLEPSKRAESANSVAFGLIAFTLAYDYRLFCYDAPLQTKRGQKNSAPYAKNSSLQVQKILYSLFVSLLDYDGNQQFFVPSCWLGSQHVYHFIFSAHAAFSCHLNC